MHRDREQEREILAHFEAMQETMERVRKFDEEQKRITGTNICYACTYGPAYRHNWIPGQCKHAAEKEQFPDGEVWPPYEC